MPSAGSTGTVGLPRSNAESGNHARRLLSEDGGELLNKKKKKIKPEQEREGKPEGVPR